jgi:hypothetical protein
MFAIGIVADAERFELADFLKYRFSSLDRRRLDAGCDYNDAADESAGARTASAADAEQSDMGSLL